MRRRAAALLLLAALAGCAHLPPAGEEGGDGGFPQVGLASFYGARHRGLRTASGERFDPAALTCAHRTAPFGARLQVTALETGRRVVVRVNDRGPALRSRIIDLSLAAARALGVVEQGVARVRVERVE